MKNKESGIYKIVNTVNAKQYIGSAVDFYGRWKTHLSSLRKNKHHSIVLQRAWNKYGEENFSFQFIESVDDKTKLLDREQYYINTLKPEYNIAQIAGSCFGLKHSKESSEKKSLNNHWRGKFGKDNPSSRLIYQYDVDGSFIKEWGGAAEISRGLGGDPGNIRTSIRMGIFSYGFFWSYQYHGEKYLDIPKPKDRSKTKRKVLQYSIEGEFINEFPSVKEANAIGKGIDACLKGIGKTAAGFIWRYKEEKTTKPKKHVTEN